MVDWLRERLVPLAPLLAVPLLLPFGRVSEVPLLLCALGGLWLLARGRLAWREPPLQLALLLFGAYWLPQLISAIDAVAPAKTWLEVFADLRFLPFLAYAVHVLRAETAVASVNRFLVALLALWSVDAWLQAFTGYSLGGAYSADRLSGIFGADNLKLGVVLAVLSPLLLLWAQRQFGAWAGAAAWLLLLPPILLAGARAAWVMLALAGALVLARGLRRPQRLAALAAAIAVTLAAVTIAYLGSPRFAERADRTLVATQGDAAALDHALAGRLPIWRTALSVGNAHPLNGVGTRGFRQVYADYAAPDDPWLAPEAETVPLHPHQLLLELYSETGLIGLLSWAVGVALAIGAWRRAHGRQRELALPAGLCLVLMLFPLNTHYAFYSSFWSMLLFVLLACWIGALGTQVRAAP